ncbi:MAG: hypothetical protein LBS60_09890 [Deltaproteobacteria bacterium]|jgi:hypothetical protein|nr:hypothetical protein [Deltaproteobacteria bacterium]
MDLLVFETSALAAFEPLAVSLLETFAITLTPFALEEIAAIKDPKIKAQLSQKAQELTLTPLALTPKIDPKTKELTAKLTAKLVKALNLPYGLGRHLALAKAAGAVALVTLDPRLLSIKILLALSRLTESWPLIVSPANLTWPNASDFSQWLAKVEGEVSAATRGLTAAQKEDLAEKWRLSPPSKESDLGFHDPLDRLSPSPMDDLPTYLNRLRQGLA